MSDETLNPAAGAVPEAGNTTVPETEIDGTSADDENPPEKVFTQAELDEKLNKRLGYERRKWEREQKQAASESQRPVSPPDPSKFTDQVSYTKAVIDHQVEAKLAEREQQKRQAEVEESYESRVDEAKTKYTDFDAKVKNEPWYCSPVVADAIRESEVGPYIAYYLADNVEESKRIFDMKSPVSQVREIGKIEAKLAVNPPVVKVSSAPEPIKPVNARSSTPTYDTSDPRSISAMSTSEWIAKRNRDIQKRSQG